MDIKAKLAQEFNLNPTHTSNIVDLIADGNTIPFIARYRKEMHGATDDQVLRDLADRLEYLQNLQKRKEEVKASIEGQGKWTDELGDALEKALTMTEVEDIYRPYKQKKKTRAMVAIERGLEPLADIIWAQEMQTVNLDELATPYINPELAIETTQDAINGAKDIIAERVSDDANCRKALRELYYQIGDLKTKLAETTDKNKDKLPTYDLYKEFNEKIKTLPSHRILAINRGENEDCLKVTFVVEKETALKVLKTAFLKSSAFDALMLDAIEDSYDRLIAPSIEREVRTELTDKASEQAIKMFEVNLKPLLMQPPLKDKVILGLDPAYRTGCKIAVIDKQGNLLEHTVIYPTPPQNKIAEAADVLKGLIKKHSVDVISIGNGTASKESEIFVADLIKDPTLSRPVAYIVVNESGASVYSASKLGTEEFPDKDVTVRSAVSIARRLLDPLAELIKIDVKSIGVGQYQHDMPQKRLSDVLGGVVEDCVNSVGVDLNTASYSLLSYIAGLNVGIAKNIVKYREETPFTSREQLLKVTKLGPKAYEQCAGFLRIPTSDNVLDNTAVHPESYQAASKLLEILDITGDLNQGIAGIKAKANEYGLDKAAEQCGVGKPTLCDIIDELSKPGRDVRDNLPQPMLRADLMDAKDLTIGMQLVGTVRNVIDFGAFVDIGVHHDGLLHISEISDNYVKHPLEILTVGQIVKVRVIGVDVQKGRINLSMRTEGLAKPAKKTEEEKQREKADRIAQQRQSRPKPSTTTQPLPDGRLNEMDGRKQGQEFRQQQRQQFRQNNNSSNQDNNKSSHNNDSNRFKDNARFDNRKGWQGNRDYIDNVPKNEHKFAEGTSVDDMLKALQNKFKH